MSGAIGGFAIGQTPIGGFYLQSFTPADMINLALRSAGLLGVGQTALPQDISDTFAMLNGMIAQWNRRRWLVWHLLDVAHVMDGSQSYSVGIGGDFDVPRPDRLEAAFFRQLVSPGNNIDYPLDILQSREDYNQIALKSLKSWATYIFYDSAYPLGYVYPWPIPQGGGMYELHLSIKDTLTQFRDLTTPIGLPPEYFQAMWTNLTIALGALYPGAVITDDLRSMAQVSLETIRMANAQIGRLRMPQGMVRPPLFNIYSYQTY